MTDRYHLMVAPTGARLQKSDHPGVPISLPEIAQTAQDCARAGANAIHVHVRNGDGSHAIDPALYADAIAAIEQVSDIDIQISTEAAGIFDVAAQQHCLAHVPARDASVALREMRRAPEALTSTYANARARGVDVQHILYSPEDVRLLLDHFERAEIAPATRRAIFVLGRYADQQRASPGDLDPFLNVPGARDLDWTLCAFGPDEQACLLAALAQGGNVRIGFENNFHAPSGAIFPDNATSVASFVDAARQAGFEPRKDAP